MESMDWNNKKLIYQWPNIISIQSKNKSYTFQNINRNIKSILKLNAITDQPEYTFDKNCTGVFTIIGCRARGWTAIPCERTFYTAFVCLPINKFTVSHMKKEKTFHIANKACDKDWLMIAGKCLTFLSSNDRYISFQNAHTTCERRNGRLLSVTQIPPPTKLKRELKLPDSIKIIQAVGARYGFKPEVIALKALGIPFTYDREHSELSHVLPLLDMLPFMSAKRPLILPLFEIITGTCWILELGYLQKSQRELSEPKKEYTRKNVHWGLKGSECASTVSATTSVCERPPYKLNITCILGHFACEDNTCILSMYVCDEINDCLNGEDEYACPKSTYTTTQSLFNLKILSDSMIICIRSENYTTHTGQVMYTHVHSICDGLHTCTIINEELCRYMKIQNIQKSHIFLFGMEKTIEKTAYKDHVMRSVFRDFDNNILEMAGRNGSSIAPKYRANNPYEKLHLMTNLHNAQDELVLPCPEMGTVHSVYDYCVIHNRYPCTYEKYSEICRPVVCSGMYKCREYACIRLSSMCDGHADCPSGEDEYSCVNISCPGVLKCRNENRCIGLEQICDGRSDCMYSSDDEMMCNQCAEGCQCVGYIIECGDIKSDLYELTNNHQEKLLKLRGHITVLSFEVYHPLNLVALDVSFCNVRRVMPGNFNKNFFDTNLFHVNLRTNLIRNDYFLLGKEFHKLFILDLGNNYLTILVNSSLVYLKHIHILKFDKNPIMYVRLSIFKNFPNLRIIDISNLYLFNTIFDLKDVQIQSLLEVRTNDSLFCCLFKNSVRCLAPVIIKCYGLIYKLSDVIVISILVSLALIISILSAGHYLYLLIRQHLKNALFSVLLNISISESLSTIYLCCIVISNLKELNIVYWQTGQFCKILQKLLAVALISNIIFRSAGSLILLSKLICPFKHQCRWLHHMWVPYVLIWILSVIYTHFIVHDYLYSYNVFCTHWCQGINRLIHLKVSLSIIEIICIFILLVSVITIHNTLKRSMDGLVTSQEYNARRRLFYIILPLAIEICVEVMFRFLGMFLVIYEYLGGLGTTHSYKVCMMLICFVMPVKIIISMSARHVKQFFFT